MEVVSVTCVSNASTAYYLTKSARHKRQCDRFVTKQSRLAPDERKGNERSFIMEELSRIGTRNRETQKTKSFRVEFSSRVVIGCAAERKGHSCYSSRAKMRMSASKKICARRCLRLCRSADTSRSYARRASTFSSSRSRATST